MAPLQLCELNLLDQTRYCPETSLSFNQTNHMFVDKQSARQNQLAVRDNRQSLLMDLQWK